MINSKKIAERIAIGILIILCGILILLEQIGVFKESLMPKWYMMILITLSMISIVLAIFHKAELYYILGFCLAGSYISLDLATRLANVTFLHTMSIIPLAVGVGILVGHFALRKHRRRLYLGVTITAIFALITASVWTQCYKIILPAMLVVFGGVIIVYNIIIASSKKKQIVNNKEDYVRPTLENKSEKD